MDPIDLIKQAVSGKAKDLIQKTSQKSSRIIEGPAKAKIPDEESARMADVRKILKKQLKMDAKLAKKEKPSKKPDAKKKVVKQNAKGIVEKVVNKKFRP